MAQVKASLWCITNNPLPVQDVRVSGHIEDFRGYFTFVQTYHTRKTQKGDVDLFFQFFLQDLGLVVGYTVLVGGEQVVASVKLTQDGDEHEELIKQKSDASSSDSLLCQLSKVPPDTRIEVRVQFIQTLRLEDKHTLSLNIPTILSPKTYFHEPQKEGFETSLRQFGFGLDLEVHSTQSVGCIESPSHPVRFNDGHLSLAPPESGQFLSDSNVVLFIKYDTPLVDTLTKAIADKSSGMLQLNLVTRKDDDYVVMVSACPQFDIGKVDFDEDDEEGHPDPREILFLIDTNQNDMNEVKEVLTASLSRLDMQVLNPLSSNFLLSVSLQLHHSW
jgi:hypothetical protein